MPLDALHAAAVAMSSVASTAPQLNIFTVFAETWHPALSVLTEEQLQVGPVFVCLRLCR
jgi:hypothetical protein